MKIIKRLQNLVEEKGLNDILKGIKLPSGVKFKHVFNGRWDEYAFSKITGRDFGKLLGDVKNASSKYAKANKLEFIPDGFSGGKVISIKAEENNAVITVNDKTNQ